MITHRNVETLTYYGICDNCMARGEIAGSVQEIEEVVVLRGDAIIYKWPRFDLCKRCNDVLGQKIEANNLGKMQKVWESASD